MEYSEERTMDIITVLHYIAIAVLEAYLIYCEYRLWMFFKQRLDARTDARRAVYRARAYRALDERTALKMSRQELWRSIRK